MVYDFFGRLCCSVYSGEKSIRSVATYSLNIIERLFLVLSAERKKVPTCTVLTVSTVGLLTFVINTVYCEVVPKNIVKKEPKDQEE